MQQHQHGHIYRAQEDKRLVREYGIKPSQETRASLRQTLETQRAKFVALEKMKAQRNQQDRGIGR